MSVHWLVDAQVVTPHGVINQGWIAVDGGRISDLGVGQPDGAPATTSLRGRLVVPGFVDLHVHGGDSVSVSADPDQCRRVVDVHRRHGTTRMVLSVVTGPLTDMAAAGKAVASLVGTGGVEGVHFEGPFLAPARCGAQNPAYLLRPDAAALDQLLRAAGGATRMVTLAPELDGGLDLVRQTVTAGAIAALGHSEAPFEVARQAFDLGAAQLTHVFNGMNPLHHRDPGLVAAGLLDDRVAVEVINDGEHLHPAVVGLVARTVGPERLLLITDAMAAAGAGDGRYDLGGQEVVVEGSRAMLSDGRSLAGSVLTMDVAFARAVREVGLSLANAVAATSTAPARVLGIDDRVGSITPGRDADLVVLGEDLRAEAVLAAGEWIVPPVP